ncbi:MAG: GNAT family N-acetyltransferase [Puniceicoccaceae bacterium]|nr:MAG: GNAT family N-acetyltransferase [Puniceicoccaceae bacterium]
MNERTKLRCGCRDNRDAVSALLDFVPAVFEGLSFRPWVEAGYWDSTYDCCSFFHGSRMIANVGWSRLEVRLDGRSWKAVQFGTVGTLPEFRRQGLAARLMRHVLDHHCEGTDFRFLFANPSVLEFYPRFGFRRVAETAFTACIEGPTVPDPSWRQLDVAHATDRRLLEDLLRSRKPVSERCAVANGAAIHLWHAVILHGGNLWWHESHRTLLVADRSAGEGPLDVFDVISREAVDGAEVLRGFLPSADRPVRFHFVPDQLGLAWTKSPDPDSLLFIDGNFPLEGKAFRIPELART